MFVWCFEINYGKFIKRNLKEKNQFEVCESIFKYTRTQAILQLFRRPPTSMLICNAVTIQMIDNTDYINDLNGILGLFCDTQNTWKEIH